MEPFTCNDFALLLDPRVSVLVGDWGERGVENGCEEPGLEDEIAGGDPDGMVDSGGSNGGAFEDDGTVAMDLKCTFGIRALTLSRTTSV